MLTLLGRLESAWPEAADAQESSLPAAGLLHPAAPGPFAHALAAVRKDLKETGFAENQNVAIHYR